jgi:hypothetical protein
LARNEEGGSNRALQISTRPKHELVNAIEQRARQERRSVSSCIAAIVGPRSAKIVEPRHEREHLSGLRAASRRFGGALRQRAGIMKMPRMDRRPYRPIMPLTAPALRSPVNICRHRRPRRSA